MDVWPAESFRALIVINAFAGIDPQADSLLPRWFKREK